MKLMIHCAYQFLAIGLVVLTYTLVYCIARVMLTNAHIPQLAPAASLVCFLLGTCSLIGAVQEAYQWACATDKRMKRATWPTCLHNSVRIPVQHLPEPLKPVSFDASYLFTGMDTTEYEPSRVPVAAGIDPQEAPITPDEVIAWLEDVTDLEDVKDTRPSWEIAGDKAFQNWLERFEPEEINQKHVAIPDTALIMPGPDLTIAYYTLGEILPSFDFTPSQYKAAYLN